MVLKRFKDQLINFLNLNYVDLHSRRSGRDGAQAHFGVGDPTRFEDGDAEEFRRLRWENHINYPIRVGDYVINLDRIARIQLSGAGPGGKSKIFFESGEPLSLSTGDTERFRNATGDLTIDLLAAAGSSSP